MRYLSRLLVVVVALVAVSACNSQPLKVTTIQVGRTLNSDNSVGTHTTTFAPTDTVYASVITGDTGSGTISAKWYYGSTMVNEMKKDVSYHGQAATEFRFHNSNGLPRGPYKVELFLDGQPVGDRTFKVE